MELIEFNDREEAGRRLAEQLAPLVSRPSVLVAIPRGGVAVALPAARRFGLPLTVVYARKLTAPTAPELAFGAVDEDGEVMMSTTRGRSGKPRGSPWDGSGLTCRKSETALGERGQHAGERRHQRGTGVELGMTEARGVA